MMSGGGTADCTNIPLSALQTKLIATSFKKSPISIDTGEHPLHPVCANLRPRRNPITKLIAFCTMAFALLYGLNVFEVVRDGDTIDLWFLATEFLDTFLIAAAIFFATHAALQSRDLRITASELTMDLNEAREKGDKWQAAAETYAQGIGTAIREQLDDWGLSDGEADIAMLLLKGLSHREIAQLRNTSENTVRQQARALYAKSGLKGRNELSAYFLEDIVMPLGSPQTFKKTGLSFPANGQKSI